MPRRDLAAPTASLSFLAPEPNPTPVMVVRSTSRCPARPGHVSHSPGGRSSPQPARSSTANREVQAGASWSAPGRIPGRPCPAAPGSVACRRTLLDAGRGLRPALTVASEHANQRISMRARNALYSARRVTIQSVVAIRRGRGSVADGRCLDSVDVVPAPGRSGESHQDAAREGDGGIDDRFSVHADLDVTRGDCDVDDV
jgi:hypothetical protein